MIVIYVVWRVFINEQKEANSEALRLFCKAIELDPDFALPMGAAGICYSRRKARGWAANRVQETQEAGRLARRAVELGRDDAVALYSIAQGSKSGTTGLLQCLINK